MTWQKAYNYLIMKKKNYNFQDETLYPLKGTLKCEYCNHPMTTSPSRGRNGIFNYYECRNKDCGKLRIGSNKAHEQFKNILIKIQPTRKVIKLFEYMVFTEWDKVINQSKETAVKIEGHIKQLKDELKSIRKAKDDEIYTTQEAQEEAERIRQEISISEIERSEVRIEQYDNQLVREFTSQFLQNLVFLWDNLDLPKRQAFLQRVFDGNLVCTKDLKIRTATLSPSFELIQALEAQKGKNVTHLYSVPNDIMVQFIETLKGWEKLFQDISNGIALI